MRPDDHATRCPCGSDSSCSATGDERPDAHPLDRNIPGDRVFAKLDAAINNAERSAAALEKSALALERIADLLEGAPGRCGPLEKITNLLDQFVTRYRHVS